MASLKKKVYEIIEEAEEGNRASEIFDIFLVALISLNVVALIVSTVEELFQISPRAFHLFELISVGVFSVEYLLRVWSCTEDSKYSHPLWGRLRYLISPLALIDLLAVMPVFLVFFVNLRGLDLRFLRVVRLLARIVRLSRYFSSLQTLGGVIQTKRGELLAVVSVLFVLLVMTSSLMFFAEHEAQPEEFASIPTAMWWEHHNLDDRRLRRRLSCHRGRAIPGRRDCHRRHRPFRTARSDTGIRLHGGVER